MTVQIDFMTVQTDFMTVQTDFQKNEPNNSTGAGCT